MKFILLFLVILVQVSTGVDYFSSLYPWAVVAADGFFSCCAAFHVHLVTCISSVVQRERANRLSCVLSRRCGESSEEMRTEMHCNQVVEAFFIHRRNMRHLQLQQPQQRHVFCLSFDADVPLLGVTWMDNAESTMCVICHDAFHFMKRKHHCRLCGRLVCNACSPARASIRSSQLERTCRLCCSVLQTLEALGDARVQSNVPSASLIVPTPRYTTPEQDFDKLMRVRKHLKTVKPSASAQYYVVSASWLQHWFDYTQRQRAHPGRISNHSLLSFYQGKLHAKRGGDFRVVHELIWCTLHELYGGGPTITTQSNMAWTIHMTDGELAETLVHTNAMRHPKKPSSLSMQCWFLTECNRRSIVGRMSELQDANGANLAKHAVDAFTSASHQARQDAQDRLSHVRLSVYPLDSAVCPKSTQRFDVM